MIIDSVLVCLGLDKYNELEEHQDAIIILDLNQVRTFLWPPPTTIMRHISMVSFACNVFEVTYVFQILRNLV